MRCLPFSVTGGALFALILREAASDPRRRHLCACCGCRMLTERDLPTQIVRCPGCARKERVTMAEEVPWRLSPGAQKLCAAPVPGCDVFNGGASL